MTKTTNLTVVVNGIAAIGITEAQADAWPQTYPDTETGWGSVVEEWGLTVTDDVGRTWEERYDNDTMGPDGAADLAVIQARRNSDKQEGAPEYFLITPYRRTWQLTVPVDAYDQVWESDWDIGSWTLKGVEVLSETEQTITEDRGESYIWDDEDEA